MKTNISNVKHSMNIKEHILYILIMIILKISLFIILLLFVFIPFISKYIFILFYLIYTRFNRCFNEEMYTFIQWGWIKLIKSDSEDIYIPKIQ